jgi:hypothetical protein
MARILSAVSLESKSRARVCWSLGDAGKHSPYPLCTGSLERGGRHGFLLSPAVARIVLGSKLGRFFSCDVGDANDFSSSGAGTLRNYASTEFHEDVHFCS